jgi:hypothetical protein
MEKPQRWPSRASRMNELKRPAEKTAAYFTRM